MIKEVVKKAMGSQGLQKGEDKQSRNSQGGDWTYQQAAQATDTAMSPELVAMLLNSQKQK